MKSVGDQNMENKDLPTAACLKLDKKHLKFVTPPQGWGGEAVSPKHRQMPRDGNGQPSWYIFLCS